MLLFNVIMSKVIFNKLYNLFTKIVPQHDNMAYRLKQRQKFFIPSRTLSAAKGTAFNITNLTAERDKMTFIRRKKRFQIRRNFKDD